MEKKKDVKIRIGMLEVFHDIANKTYLTGESRMAEGLGFEAGSRMEVSQDDEHAYQVKRSMSNALSHLKVELGEYLLEDGSDSNNRINDVVERTSMSEDERAGRIASMIVDVTSPAGASEGDSDALGELKGVAGNVLATDGYAGLVRLLKIASGQETYAEDEDSDYNVPVINNKDILRQVDDILTWNSCQVVLDFKLPSNFNSAACDSLGNGIHEYIVGRSIYDWFSITDKNDAADYLAAANAALENAKKALYKRERPSRPLY